MQNTTQGPWAVRIEPSLTPGFAARVQVHSEGQAIATLHGDASTREGNAALIAAAPDLLAACEAFLAMRYSKERLTMAQIEALALAAIKKAKGEQNNG